MRISEQSAGPFKRYGMLEGPGNIHTIFFHKYSHMGFHYPMVRKVCSHIDRHRIICIVGLAHTDQHANVELSNTTTRPD